MKKSLLTLIVSLSLFSSVAQEQILEFSNSLKTSSSNLKDVIPIVNKKNGDISIFIADAKNVYGYKFDKNLKPVEKISSEEKRRKYKTIIGNSIEDNGDYLIYLTNKKENKFAFVRFSFESKSSSVVEFTLKPKEKFIQTVSINNKFYLISGNKINQDLYVSSFDTKGTLRRNKIDMPDAFFTNSGTQVKAGQLLMNNNITSIFNPTKDKPLTKIEENTPNSIESASASKKMYIRGNTLILSFDNHKEYTQVLEIDLKTMIASKKEFKKPLGNIKSNRKKTNSFILKDKIFVVGGTKEIFSMHVIDYTTGKLIKEYTVVKNENISFKNSPIIQEGGMYNGYRELEKTKKFLRKITAGKIGVSVIEQGGNYITTIGGYVEQARAGGMMGMPSFGGIPIGSIGNVSVFFNPSAFAFNSFSNTKSTRIECVFGRDFNHVKGEISKNAFDKIKDTKFRNTSGETVFKYGDYYIKGYYKSRIKKYFLTKFTND